MGAIEVAGARPPRSLVATTSTRAKEFRGLCLTATREVVKHRGPQEIHAAPEAASHPDRIEDGKRLDRHADGERLHVRRSLRLRSRRERTNRNAPLLCFADLPPQIVAVGALRGSADDLEIKRAEFVDRHSSFLTSRPS